MSYPVSTASYSPNPDVSMWNSAPVWDPVEESTTTFATYRTSQPSPEIMLPPPPQYQTGALEHFQDNFEYGNSESETEQPSSPPALPPYLGPSFQAGELSQYESTFEHGNEDRETEEQGFRPFPPYASARLGAGHRSSQMLPAGPTIPNYHRRLFLTGQLPPGTYSNFQTDYETGANNRDESSYERYHYPIADNQNHPTQTKEAPRDVPWQRTQQFPKAQPYL